MLRMVPLPRFAGQDQKANVGNKRDQMTSSTSTATAQNQLTSVTRVTVEPKDTVGALDPSMPQVASTPYLVTVAEFACARLVKDQLEPGQITVGTRVVIDHLGASKVGAELVVKAILLNREKNAFGSRSRWRMVRALSPRSSMSARRCRSKKS
jgi:predicted thioesterase